MTEAIRKVPTPALILCGDEDDNCVEPSLFLKQHLPAAGLSFFPKSGHVLNLEEPALFNEMVERFIALVEAGRWPVRDARSMMAGADPSFRGEAKHEPRFHCDQEGWIRFVASLLGMTRSLLPLPRPRLSKNTPCSPNMFHTHHGRFSGTGRP